MVALAVPKIGRPDALAAVMRGAALPFASVFLLGVGDVVGIGNDAVLGEMARALWFGRRRRRRTARHEIVEANGPGSNMKRRTSTLCSVAGEKARRRLVSMARCVRGRHPEWAETARRAGSVAGAAGDSTRPRAQRGGTPNEKKPAGARTRYSSAGTGAGGGHGPEAVPSVHGDHAGGRPGLGSTAKAPCFVALDTTAQEHILAQWLAIKDKAGVKVDEAFRDIPAIRRAVFVEGMKEGPSCWPGGSAGLTRRPDVMRRPSNG